jgi:membrane-associated phospholipid phosphatase
MESTSVGASRAGFAERIRPLVPWAALVVYALALGVAVAVRGLPTARDALLLWIMLGLLAASLTNVRRWFRGLLQDWLPFMVVLFAYDLSRGYADSFLTAHVEPQLRFDEIVFGEVPSVWLQQQLWDGAAAIDWIDYSTWVVYLTHFFATLTVGAALWLFAAHLFRRYMAAVCVLAVVGFATYALFPAVPPWMASRDGHLEHTERIVRTVSLDVPVDYFGAIWQSGERYANDVAAVPSLHAAYALLIALFLWPVVSRRWRIALAAYPVAMAFALVYSAEHYVSDVLLGWVYAVAALAAVELARRREPVRRWIG